MRLNRRNHRVNPRHHLPEAETAGAGCANAVFFSVLDLVHQRRAFDQRLARHATVVEAIAAHFVGFYQRHFGFDHGGNVSRYQTRRAAANHHQVAVKVHGFYSAPACIDLAFLHQTHSPFGQQRKHPQQHKRANQRRAENALERGDLRQLRACIHIHRGARQHAQLADPIKGAHWHLGQAHHQVDDEKRHQRHQPQCE